MSRKQAIRNVQAALAEKDAADVAGLRLFNGKHPDAKCAHQRQTFDGKLIHCAVGDCPEGNGGSDTLVLVQMPAPPAAHWIGEAAAPGVRQGPRSTLFVRGYIDGAWRWIWAE
ncbi:MAG TPA: hypothetical protein VGS99_03750 [Gammaproteobacteria bacterium]|nr:hypothetical protein [Gammaproteobacteria bacterium]